MSSPVFEVIGVTYWYPGGAPVLKDVSLTIADGEAVAILGANACGKSTLLHLLDGLCFAAQGTVSALGTVLTEESVEMQPFCCLFRQSVGYVFQNSEAQLFCTSVAEELAFGPLQLRLPEGEVERRVTDTLGLFGIEHLRDRPPQTLSGGEKKRVALASVISCAPKVVLLDEPSAGLDPRTQQWLAEFVGLLHQSGVTVVATSHDLGFVAEITDRALILSEDHRLVYDGPVREALSNLDLLLSVNLVHAHSHVHDGETHIHPHMHETWHEHVHPHGHGT